MSRPKVTWKGPVKIVTEREKPQPGFCRRRPGDMKYIGVPATIGGVKGHLLPWGKVVKKWTTVKHSKFGKIGSPKPRKGLRQVSSRRKRELKEYREEHRPAFLARPENRYCPVYAAGILGKARRVRTRDVHHKYSRLGKWLNVERLWMAVSRTGHQWIHENAAEARARGWIVDKP